MQEDSVKHDDILDFTIYYDGSYPDGLTKEKKRAVRKRAAKLETEKGEVFLLRIKVVQTEKEQKQILQACVSDPTSGHYGVMIQLHFGFVINVIISGSVYSLVL